MYYIAMTGGIGSGKSTVSDRFANKGIDIIDADIIAHQLTQPGNDIYQKIINHFGKSILQPDLTLDRQRLRKIIFNNPDKKKWLEALTHPAIRNAIDQQRQEATSTYCIIVIPLLTDTTHYPYINRICVIETDPNIQIERASLRDQNNPALIQKIIDSQADQVKRRQIADDLIDNNQDLNHLHQQVDQLHQRYLQLSGNAPCQS